MHPKPETLALLALGEAVASPAESAHLVTCAECASTLDALRDAVRIGRSTIDIGPLERPAAHVWDRIAAELALPEIATTSDAAIADRGRVRRVRRRWVVTVAAGVLVVAAAAGLLVRFVIGAAPRVESSATLLAYPAWEGSTGSAVVEVQQNGVRTVTVHVHVEGAKKGAHEVWLMTGDLKALVSLGDLHSDSGVFVVPARINLSQYDVVDVSDEPNDGNPKHSGDSIVRGSLRAG